MVSYLHAILSRAQNRHDSTITYGDHYVLNSKPPFRVGLSRTTKHDDKKENNYIYRRTSTNDLPMKWCAPGMCAGVFVCHVLSERGTFPVAVESLDERNEFSVKSDVWMYGKHRVYNN